MVCVSVEYAREVAGLRACTRTGVRFVPACLPACSVLNACACSCLPTCVCVHAFGWVRRLLDSGAYAHAMLQDIALGVSNNPEDGAGNTIVVPLFLPVLKCCTILLNSVVLIVLICVVVQSH